MDEIQKIVWERVQAMNRMWTVENNPDELMNYFHKDMVAITPNDHQRREGASACVAGWKSFCKAARIHSFREIDPKIQLYGNCKFAVVTYYYDMSFEMDGQNMNLLGRDMFVLVHEEGKWWIVADQFSEYPKL